MEKPARKAHIREKQTKIILRQAEEIFAEKGYNGTSIQEIADNAGVPKANIHYYFPTKKELYTCVLKDILEAWMDDANIFDQTDNPEKILRAYITKKMNHSFSRPSGSKLWAMEIIQGGPIFGQEIKEQLIAWDRKIIKRIKTWVSHKKIRPIDPQTLLYMIWATTQHYADFELQITTLNSGVPLSKQAQTKAVKSVCDILLSGILLSE